MRDMLPKLSIIIPTCDRASSLREALRSVQCQSARQAIAQVIVSESGTSDKSREVCAEFTNLPILYEQERASGPPLRPRWKATWNLVQSPLVAFLHDEEWWAPDHLEAALDVLELNQDCVAVYANFYKTEGAKYPARSSRKAWRVWVSSGCDFRRPVLFLDEVSIMLISLLDDTLHYSSLVGRGEVIWEAYQQVITVGDQYNDARIFPVLLSAKGTIAYVTSPNVFIHAGPYVAATESRTTGWDREIETTKWLLKREPEKGVLAATKFNQAVSTLSRSGPSHHAFPTFRTVFNGITGRQWDTLVAECGIDLREPSPAKDTTWFLKLFCPPGLLEIYSRFQSGQPYAVQRKQD